MPLLKDSYFPKKKKTNFDRSQHFHSNCTSSSLKPGSSEAGLQPGGDGSCPVEAFSWNWNCTMPPSIKLSFSIIMNSVMRALYHILTLCFNLTAKASVDGLPRKYTIRRYFFLNTKRCSNSTEYCLFPFSTTKTNAKAISLLSYI